MLLLTVLATCLVGCSRGSGSDADGARLGPDRAPDGLPPLRQGALEAVRTFAFGLGVDPLDHAAIERLGRYDLVAVDGSATNAQVAALHRRGALVLGYLSVGTVEPYRAWYATAKRNGWLLEHWDEWDEWYVEVSEPGYRDLLVAEAKRQRAVGFDGVFLDNTDMIDTHPAQAAGMAEAVAALDEAVGPKGLLFAQNGDTVVDRFVAHLDGWNREDVTETYDFDAKRYVPVDASDHRQALATLRRLRKAGLLVTATDYTKPGDTSTIATATADACRSGAIPFASNIDLSRIPATPPACA